jgi:hypothetical protein
MQDEHNDDIQPEVSDTAGVETETYDDAAEDEEVGPSEEEEQAPADVDDEEGDTL